MSSSSSPTLRGLAVLLGVALCLVYTARGLIDPSEALVTYEVTLSSSDDDWPTASRAVRGTLRLVLRNGRTEPGLANTELDWDLRVQRPAFVHVPTGGFKYFGGELWHEPEPIMRRRWLNESADRFVVLFRSRAGDVVYHLAPRATPHGTVPCSDAVQLCEELSPYSNWMTTVYYDGPRQPSLASWHVLLLDHWPWSAPEVPRDTNASAARRASTVRIGDLPARGRLVAW